MTNINIFELYTGTYFSSQEKLLNIYVFTNFKIFFYQDKNKYIFYLFLKGSDTIKARL